MKTAESNLKSTTLFWNNFYSSVPLTQIPSSFCKWIIDEYLQTPTKIIELGCGNGRDTFAFCKNGNSIIAIDESAVAIKNNTIYFAENNFNGCAEFINENISAFCSRSNVLDNSIKNMIYSRFFMHAITEDLEDKLIYFLNKITLAGTLVAHEFRTDKDPLKDKGKIISTNERLTDHYRRFINFQSFIKKHDPKLWFIEYQIESQGLAVFGNEDPFVARIVLRKK